MKTNKLFSIDRHGMGQSINEAKALGPGLITSRSSHLNENRNENLKQIPSSYSVQMFSFDVDTHESFKHLPRDTQSGCNLGKQGKLIWITYIIQ